MKVLHVITTTDIGGAEMVLASLLPPLQQRGIEAMVVSLRATGSIGKSILDSGVPVVSVGLDRELPGLRQLVRLRRVVKEFQPDVCMGWMYHGALASLAIGNRRGTSVLWGIHQVDLDPSVTRLRTRVIGRVLASASRCPDRIIFCSDAAERKHREFGFSGRHIVIRNGFDPSTYYPSQLDRVSVREEIGIPPGAIVIGNINRFHPIKDHMTFFRAVAILQRNGVGWHYLCAGAGMTDDNPELLDLIRQTAAQPENIHLLGARKDVPRLLRALDALVSSSISESFPMIVGEAMATEVTCVVTDVGDSATLVGDSGVVVEVGKPELLADALLMAVQEKRMTCGRKARSRIVNTFDVASTARQYEETFRSALKH